MEYTTTVTIDAQDFASNASQSDILEFIKELDLAVGDWTLTLELAKHFAALRHEWELEQVSSKDALIQRSFK